VPSGGDEMNKPQKWAEVIKAWADGVEIEHRYIGCDKWCNYGPDHTPTFTDNALQFRIKPKKKSPNEVLAQALWPEENWDHISYNKDFYNKAALAVINAYKNGELDV
jgi:hypothetical protein